MAETDGQPVYEGLSPDTILDAVESAGLACNGHLFALNSYENRVYQVGLEDGSFRVVKFYRPGRWSDAAIGEEHAFMAELAAHDIPVVAPLADAAGATLRHWQSFRYAIFPRIGGRALELDDSDQLEQLGRLLGRMHAVGAVRPFRHRPALDIEHFGAESCRYLLENDFLPPDLRPAYRSLAADLLEGIRACYERAGDWVPLRLHGDCHPGNLLVTPDGLRLVDFDDARSGPAVQDLWMFLSGEHEYMSARLRDLLEGYTEFCDFNPRELHLIEALRTLRYMHYAAWLARRWHDPAFPRAFPWFGSGRYWEEHILALREQAAALSEPPLTLM